MKREQGGKKDLFLLLLLVVFGSVAGILTYFGIVAMKYKAPIQLIENPKHRVAAFEELLKENYIAGLPAEFSFIGQDTKVDYFAAENTDGEIFKLIRVVYPVKKTGSGHRSCSFVFNSAGECVFWSKDSWCFPNGGLVDVTGEGHVEKIVEFTEVSEDGLSRFKDRLKVVRITGDKPELLFDLRYIIWITPIDAAVVWAIPEGDQYILRLTSDSYKKVLFKWSAEEQKFSVEGQDSPYWEVLYYGPGVAAGE